MVKKIIYVLLALVLIYLGICAIAPKSYHIQVTRTISATPDRVFEQIGDYKNWPNWSSWDKRDPNMKKKFGATTSGLGGNYSWESKMGDGSQEFTEYIPNKKLVSKLYFKGFNSYMNATFELVDKNGSTDVTWHYDDLEDKPFFVRGFMKILGFEGNITKDYNEGLNNLEAYFKSHPATTVSTPGSDSAQ